MKQVGIAWGVALQGTSSTEEIEELDEVGTASYSCSEEEDNKLESVAQERVQEDDQVVQPCKELVSLQLEPSWVLR